MSGSGSGADADDVVAALKEFGFSAYEAETFLALQRLGVGSARDVHELSGVPRSQVYGAAESLADAGLIDVQKTNPQVYRPAAVEEVKDRLRSRFETRYDLVVDHLTDLADRREPTSEQRQDVWRIEGAASVASRAVKLLETADDEVVYVLGERTLVTAAEESAVRSLVDRGVEVTVVSPAADLRDRFEAAGAEALSPDVTDGSPAVSRILVVDTAGLLLSVRGREETAIWSLDTMFSRTLSELVRESLVSFVGGFST